MKRKNVSSPGDMFMGLGPVVIVVDAGYPIFNRLPQFNMPQYFAYSAMLSIFVDVIPWLAGARVDEHEQMYDRYWWTRRYDECRHRSGNHRCN